MHIKNFELFPVKIPLLAPFTTALHSVDVKGCILVRLESDDGLVGWGEAAPEVEITGDDSISAYNVLIDKLKNIVVGKSIDDEDEFSQFLRDISVYIDLSATAVAAVDIALHDLWSRSQNMPLCGYFGGVLEPIKTSISIGMMETEALMERIQAVFETGGTSIKLKIGAGIEADVELIERVRNRFGNVITLRLDANQAYSAPDAITLLEKLDRFDIEFVEQPVPADDLKGLKSVYENSPIPVMADEAVKNILDIVNISEGDICNKVNLKLMKSGGLFQLERMIRYCGDNHIDCMIGCMIETPVGISAGVNLSLQGDPVKWTDLDGHLFLKNIDGIFTGFRTEGDFNIISGEVGLGIECNEVLLDRFVTYPE